MTTPLTSKERVRRTFAHRESDRVPINYMANGAIDRRLKAHYGLAPDDGEGLLRALGVDFRSIGPHYTGPKLHADIPERGVFVDDWGNHRRWVEHATGGYWDYCEFPLRDADSATLRNWPMPSPDDFDYTVVPAQCERAADFCIVAGNAGVVDIINGTSTLRGMETVLVDLALDDADALAFIDRRLDILYEITRRTLDAARGAVDLLHIGEDLGTQIGPMISLDLFRKHLRPRHQRFVDLGKHYGARIMIHSCGTSIWAFPDFIDMGIDVVDTLQPEAANMQPAYLKREFGDRLALHGCISTAGPVATGTAAETADYCRDMLRTLMPDGGYCFAPTHMLQDNSPTENVVAMYDVAKVDGVYA